MKTWRWTPKALLSIVALALLLPGMAVAQGLPSAADEAQEGEEIKGDTKVAEIFEVERGFHLSVDYGPNYFLGLTGNGMVDLNPNWTGVGTRMGVRVGYDILNNLSADAFVLANFNKGEFTPGAELSGDLAHFAPGVGFRFSFVTTQRFFAYARVGAGYAFWLPSDLAGGSTGSIHLDGALGMEYYTALRHISLGLELDTQALLLPTAVGFQLYPTVKYTF